MGRGVRLGRARHARGPWSARARVGLGREWDVPVCGPVRGGPGSEGGGGLGGALSSGGTDEPGVRVGDSAAASLVPPRCALALFSPEGRAAEASPVLLRQRTAGLVGPGGLLRHAPRAMLPTRG